MRQQKPSPSSVKKQKNYITPKGMKKLQEELSHLYEEERKSLVETISWAAGNGDRSENGDYIYAKRRLREVDSRIHYISKQLENAELIDPTRQSGTKVLFGATVTLRMENGETEKYRIVGVDEADISQRKLSWLSPLSQALLGVKEGEFVTYKSPQGEQEIELIKVKYLAID